MSFEESCILDHYSMASAGEKKEVDLPRGFVTCLIDIIQQGDHTTDASTHAERIAGFGEISIKTTRGIETLIDSEDLEMLMLLLERRMFGLLYDGGGGDANDEVFDVIRLPLSIGLNKWHGRGGALYGLDGSIARKIIVNYDTDANAGCDSRELTIIARGIKGERSVGYLTFMRNTLTLAANAYSYIPLGGGKLRGAFLYHTSSPTQGDGTDTNPTCSKLAIKKDRGKEIISRYTIADLFSSPAAGLPDDPAGTLGLPLDSWTLWDLDPEKLGLGFITPSGQNYELGCYGAIAEAIRAYPLVYVPT